LDAHRNRRIVTYDAPETAPDGFIRRVLCIPVDDDYRIVAAVNDVLGYLSLPGVWNPSEEVSDIDMQALMTEMWLGYFGELEIMIGAVVPMATDVLPSFMVWCEGQTLTRAAYPELYGRLNSVYRIDAETFFVPDLRAKFIFGSNESDEESGDFVTGAEGGEQSVTLEIDHMPEHSHTNSPHSHIYDYPTFNLDLETPGAPDIFGLGSPGTPYPTSADSITIDSSGGGQPHQNMPPYHVLRFAMVAKWRDCC
jgi:microcystin-dependent protein